MKNKIQKAYILTCEEYNILLAASQMRECYMLQTGKYDITNEKICNAMMHLYSTGIIDSDGRYFIIKDEIRQIIEEIKSARTIILVRMKSSKDRVLCCYKVLHENEQSFVVNEVSEYDENSYRIYRMDATEFKEFVITASIIQTHTIGMIEEDEMYDFVCDINNKISLRQFQKYVNLQVDIECLTADEAEVEKRLLVLLKDNKKILLLADKEGFECETFTEDAIKEKLDDFS